MNLDAILTVDWSRKIQSISRLGDLEEVKVEIANGNHHCTPKTQNWSQHRPVLNSYRPKLCPEQGTQKRVSVFVLYVFYMHC